MAIFGTIVISTTRSTIAAEYRRTRIASTPLLPPDGERVPVACIRRYPNINLYYRCMIVNRATMINSVGGSGAGEVRSGCGWSHACDTRT